MERLPIKFFGRREIDKRRPEGSRGNPPTFVLHGEELLLKADILRTKLNDISEKISRKSRSNPYVPAIIKVNMSEDAIAKSHRIAIKDLFSSDTNKNSILANYEESNLLVKISDNSTIKKINNRFINFEENAYGISCIDDIELFHPTIIKGMEVMNYKVKLINFQNYQLNTSVENIFENFCENSGINFSKTDYAKNFSIYNLIIPNCDAFLNDLDDDICDLLYSFEPMPKLPISFDSFQSEDTIEIKHPKDNTEYPIIGVLDSGIKSIPHLAPWIIDKHSSYPPQYINHSHGTFVSGIIIYGDQLEKNQYTGLEGCKLYDATVMPDLKKEIIYEDELIRNIKEVIGKNHEKIKIWNLSLGTNIEIDDNSFSDFAIALDEIQDTYNVLICKSAGNCGNFRNNAPKSKIAKSADSIRSLVVGSIAQDKLENDIVDVNYPSPFSRTGRGPAHIIKPDIVHYGGNASKNSITGVSSFGVDGSIIKNVGTSFSTPRITALSANLYHTMAEDFNPLLLKALIIHSSQYHKNVSLEQSEKLNQLGYGTPKNVEQILYNSPYESTVILMDELNKQEYIDILDFPYPESLKRDGYFEGQITLTLLSNPVLDPSQGSEYCQSNIKVSLGTYDSKKERDTSKRTILNPIGKNGNLNLLLSSVYSRRRSSTSDFALKERQLIEFGDKYYPVKKYVIDLAELTSANREMALKDNRKWFLQLKNLFRDHTINKAKEASESLSQEFCLIITIKDPKKIAPVYNEMANGLANENFIPQNIKLREEINIPVKR